MQRAQVLFCVFFFSVLTFCNQKKIDAALSGSGIFNMLASLEDSLISDVGTTTSTSLNTSTTSSTLVNSAMPGSTTTGATVAASTTTNLTTSGATIAQMAANVYAVAGKSQNEGLSPSDFTNAMLSIHSQARGSDLPGGLKQAMLQLLLTTFNKYQAGDNTLHFNGLVQFLTNQENAMHQQGVSTSYASENRPSMPTNNVTNGWNGEGGLCPPGEPCLESRSKPWGQADISQNSGGYANLRAMTWTDILRKYDTSG